MSTPTSQIAGNDTISESPIQSEATIPPPIDSPDVYDISTISILRQYELYTSPQMNEVSDLFVNGGDGDLKAKLHKFKSGENEDLNGNATGDSAKPPADTEDIDTKQSEETSITEADPAMQFWLDLLENTASSTAELEKHLIDGIPVDVRSLVYLKTLQVRYKFSSREGYADLVKKASQPLDDPKEVLNVFQYYGSKSPFVLSIFDLVSSIPGLLKEETLFILFKFNKMLVNLNQEEYFYKVSRSLEDYLAELFNHITSQGIQIDKLGKKYVDTFFDKIEEERLKILDFLVFEGFDFVLRLILFLFDQNKEFVLQLGGLELLAFLNSPEFFEVDLDWHKILGQASQIIRYENEYHLIHANSFSNNNNELKNLQETSTGLKTTLAQLTTQLQDLQTTHDEIIQQNDDFNSKLTEALDQNDKLLTLKDELQEKYENLSMKQNLKNTIKANKEFSERNLELENQINDLKKSIAEKRLRLEKA